MPVHKILSALKNPKQTSIKIQAKYAPERFYESYSSKCKNTGITEPLFILSFDCDTEKDITVAWDMHSQLMDMGIQSVYAVPGELLQKGEKTYKKILDSGSEFINHGYKDHTYFDQNLGYQRSCFFYDQQTKDIAENDIRRGHENLEKVLGVSAKGWRTPHFGTFEKPADLQFLHGILNDLNYNFSTSSKPHYGWSHGPIFNDYGLKEIPVTAMTKNPTAILDSWAFFEAPDKIYDGSDYLNEVQNLTNIISNRPWLINLYADPLHIYDKPDFFKAMKHLANHTKSIQFNDFTIMTEQQKNAA